MMKVNLKAISIDDLLGSPGNRNTRACRRHHNNVPIWAPFEIMNVAIMRQDLWPQLQVRGCFEDQRFRSIHDNRVDLAHRILNDVRILTHANDRRCESFAEDWDSLSKRS